MSAESPQLTTLGELSDQELTASSAVPRRVSPIVIWAGFLLFIAMAYHYAFEMQPLARIAMFKKAVADSNGDWVYLERRIRDLGLTVRGGALATQKKSVSLCPAQAQVKSFLDKHTRRIPLLRNLPNMVCTQYANIRLDPGMTRIEKVEYR